MYEAPPRKFTMVSEAEGHLSRREFMTWAATFGLTLSLLEGDAMAQGLRSIYTFLEPVTVDNPLQFYPNRDWERVYRDLYRTDGSFVFLCAPNDTHNCLLRALVKNDVVARIEPTFGYKNATDQSGNRASGRWDPRACQKGLILARRFYGDRRIKFPMIRKGFKAWIDAKFPRESETGAPPAAFFRRGEDTWLRLSWDEAQSYMARALIDITTTYTGKRGAERLTLQGYDPVTIGKMQGHGTQVLKLRGGMAFLGATRIFGLYRFANMLSLLDAWIQKIGPDKAKGAVGWDSYSWHTDLPPGHPMVTGQQTVDFDLFAVEHADQVLVWGMNWIATKMPESHWLTEARLKGTKVVVITCEYSATSCKGDEVLVIRPGSDAALALGFAHVILRDGLYDKDFVAQFTDLPLLIRMDTLGQLGAAEVFDGYQNKPLANGVKVLDRGERPPQPIRLQNAQYLTNQQREEWGDFVVFDSASRKLVAVSRDEVGVHFAAKNVNPALEGEFDVQLADGKVVKARPVFDLVKEYLEANFDPESVAQMTWAPADAVKRVARSIASHREKTLFANGMGPNQFFNNDLKDRAIFLVAALTRNVGFLGGSVGSFSGNYRVDLFNGMPQYVAEDPFDIELDPSRPARVRKYDTKQSAHFFNYGDRPLRVKEQLFTEETHLPTPTKLMWLSNSNSIIANARWHYDVVYNTLPKVECVAIADWWWTGSCEWADLVFAVDAWSEFKMPDMTASSTNPFVQVFPRTPLKRSLDTRGDAEVLSGVAEKLTAMTGDPRFGDYWRFISNNQVEVYLQRILDASSALAGYRFEDLEAKAKQGTPALINVRTYPRVGGWEQTKESKPWYTRTGRLEFYRSERAFLDSGENLPVYREPIDSTFYEPNVIVGRPHRALRPVSPITFGQAPADLSAEARQVRHVLKPWEEVRTTRHPLSMTNGFKFIFHTPKSRHGAHSTPVDTDFMATWFGPFGDIYRRDKRSPFAGEGYVDINPRDAAALGIDDGDYVWIDADPEDRPFRGWQGRPEDFHVGRLLARARYYPGTPTGVLRTWHNMYGATPGSVKGAQTRKDGLARNPATGYQAMYRFGSHQSATRAWLKPTHMTDSLVHKGIFTQALGSGFEADVHCPTGATREAFVKVSRAEAGGYGGKGQWRPAALGFRPSSENAYFRQYLRGDFVRIAKRQP